jgi:hypothetical protein
MRSLANLSDEERIARLIRLCESIKPFSLESAIATWRSALLLAAFVWRAAAMIDRF